MKKVQRADGQKRTLDELYKRYEKRGDTYDRSPEYAEQKSREISVRATASKSYRISAGGAENLKKYKNGVSGTRRYMTDGDFANYYRARSEYSPGANVELEVPVILQKVNKPKINKSNMKTEKSDIRKKLEAEANRNNPKGTPRVSRVKKQKSVKRDPEPSKIKEIAREAARTWIPLDERYKENIVEGTKTKIPVRIILAILAITLSLLMIVGSAVLLSEAQREQSDLEAEIEALDFQINELKTDLNKKNENIDIEFYAEEVLGMINQEHVAAEYINSNKTDGVERNDADESSLASLIEWFFQFLK